jgi:hypothetical protein
MAKIQFEQKTMTFGPPKNIRPHLNGFWLDAEHCEICAPQEKRIERNRCQTHAEPACAHRQYAALESATRRVVNIRCFGCGKIWELSAADFALAKGRPRLI